MRIITLASTKGGVGKSTTATLVADAILRQGKTVRVIDFDTQRSLTRWATPISKRNDLLSIHHFELKPEADVKAYYNAMLADLEDQPDWVILDTKGSDDARQLAALALCDLVLAPSGPIRDEVLGLEKTLAYFANALELTDESAADPMSMFLVLYQATGGFLNAAATGYHELIHKHYGAIEGLNRSISIGSFMGEMLTTEEAITAAIKENRNVEPYKKMQHSADALVSRIAEKFNE